MTEEQPIKTMSRMQVAEMLHCNPQSITDKFMKKDTTFPRPLKIGRRLFWFTSEMNAWLKEQARE